MRRRTYSTGRISDDDFEDDSVPEKDGELSDIGTLVTYLRGDCAIS